MEPIIFYDADCPLCNRTIRFILRADVKKKFFFAPLSGKTAKKKLAHLYIKDPNLDTLVLLDQGKLYIEGRGAIRILWLLGGKWKLIGWISFLPSSLFDFFYRIVARYRYRLFSGKVHIDKKNVQERFLP